ncbi:putative S-adenosylmethionine-dependent methyltransferase [uncultured archaeon]|nr:putative S-adenosylmethionine-dependent methyltransferase [uncultured archaeon]
MKKEDFGDILKKEQLEFKSQNDLENYYNSKYDHGGYKGGYKLFGVNISRIYHKNRQKISLELLNPKKDEIILDAGCGNGELTKKIAKSSLKVYGVDISKTAIFNAKKRAPKNCIFKYGDLEELNFPDKSFDKIVCVETIEHVLHPNKVIKEFKRILKNNGKLVLCFPTINTNLINKLELSLGFRKFFSISEHLNEWNYSGFKKLVENNGFRFINSKGVVFSLGRLEDLKKINKSSMYSVLKFQLSLNSFPSNSNWAVILFEKK